MELKFSLPYIAYEEVEGQNKDIESFKAGKISEEIFKSRRVPRGIYAQRGENLYMMRVRVPGGILFSSQLRCIAELSRENSQAPLHLTTRQDVQFHDVPLENTTKIMEGLLEEELTPLGGGGNTVRNITCCSHSGFYQGEEFDVLPYAQELTEYLLPEKSSYNLPRKFKTAFSCCREDEALARVNDLGFIARRDGNSRGFTVYVGGGMGTISRPGVIFRQFLPEEDVIPLTVAVLRIFDRFGDRRNRHYARLRFVVEKLGEEKFFQSLEEELEKVKEELPVVSSSKGKVEGTRSGTQSQEGNIKGKIKVSNIKEGEFEFKHLIREQKQEGYVYLYLPLKRGNITPSDLNCLADITENYASSQVRIDRRQNIIIPFIPEGSAERLYKEIRGALEYLSEEPQAWMVACKGADTCKLGICRAQDLSAAISRKAEEAGIPSSVFAELEVHSSGCPNNCGQHSAALLGFFGAARRKEGRSYPLYNIVGGGKKEANNFRLSEAVGKIPAKNVPEFTAELLQDYMNSGLRAQGFSVYWEDRGYNKTQELIEKWSSVPPYSEDPSYYRDWGSEEDFSLAGRSAGECGAGVVELIAEELKRSETVFSQADNSEDASQKAEYLLEAVSAAAGSLLVTKGIEPGNPDTAFREFERQFLDNNLASDKHRELLVAARNALRGNKEELNPKREEIREFMDEVQDLYDHMDASLNFPVRKEKEEADEEKGGEYIEKGEKSRKELDLRGVACPMNFVHAKMALEKLPVGAELEVILDKGEPVENVPRSFEDQGEEVVSITPEGDEHFRVVVRRRQ